MRTFKLVVARNVTQSVVASICATKSEADEKPAAVKFTPAYRTEPSRDLIQRPRSTPTTSPNSSRVATPGSANSRYGVTSRARREDELSNPGNRPANRYRGHQTPRLRKPRHRGRQG